MYSLNQNTYKAAYNRLEWEFTKFRLNATIIAERQAYLDNVLLTDIRCAEDSNLPQLLIDDYIKNGTNLRCPKGTESERGSWCLGQCAVDLASKVAMSVLNPVKDVIGITSLTGEDIKDAFNSANLGSEFTRDNPNWEED